MQTGTPLAAVAVILLTGQAIFSLMLNTGEHSVRLAADRGSCSFLPAGFSFTWFIPARREERVRTVRYPVTLGEVAAIHHADDSGTIMVSEA